MEVEEQNQDLEINLLDNYCYKILYPNQNYKKSIEYQKWKSSIEKKIGSNGIEIFCNKDKIVIFKKYENLEQIKCPICNGYFYYCPNCKSYQKCLNCCSKSLIKKLLKDERLKNYMNLKDNKEERSDFIIYFIIMFIPFLSNMVIYIYINHILYFGIGKNGIENGNRKFNSTLKFLQIFSMFGIFISLSLIYMILHYIFYLIIFFFSLPFKLFPIKLLISLFCIS